MAYEFHYTPTGTGVISGKEVLEQTEDAINDLGNTAISGVQEALDKAEQALTNSENAVDDAQTALNTANNAEGVAIQAQNDVTNLSGTVTNIGNRVTTAEGNITNLQGRMTTAEGNITNLQGRMTTAEGNIGNLQTDVSTAQATANSAQQTATTARQQSYVFRYSSTALVASSTNSNTLLDNTDNLKVGDKVIDSDGVLFSVTAIDTANSTFTIGTALIDLAQDSDVVHKSGDETVGGVKTFSDLQIIGYGTQYKGSRNAYILPEFAAGYSGLSITTLGFAQNLKIGNFVLDANNKPSLDTSKAYIQIATGENNGVNACILEARNSTSSSLGTSGNKWSKIYGTEYYYGSNNVEFSTKFVTTDTNQTISGNKTFANNKLIVGRATDGTSVIQFINSDVVGDSASGTSGFEVYGTSVSDANKIGGVTVGEYSNNSGSYAMIECNRTVSGVKSSNIIRNLIRSDGSKELSATIDNDCKLGNAFLRWSDVQTYKVNALEPSSLSLPSGNANDVIDISSYITALDGTSNSYTVPANGWISIAIVGTAIAIVSSSWSDSRLRASSGNVRMLYPVLKNETLGISVIGTTLDYARFIPCQGNV